MKKNKQHINPFWGPNIKAKPRSSFGFKPVPLWRNNNVGKVSRHNLTWPQAQVKYPRMDPFGDADRDGKLNMFDCRPFDRKRHSELMRDEIANKLYIKGRNPKGAYKKVVSSVKKYRIPREGKFLRKYIAEGSWKNDYIPESVNAIKPIDYRTNAGKSLVEDIARNKYKMITEIDIIKHVEKHPQLLKNLQKIKSVTANPIHMEGYEGWASNKKDAIALRSSLPKKYPVGEALEHEMSHIEQKPHSKEELKKIVKNREDATVEEYNEMPNEVDAENRRKARRAEWESWKEEQPTALTASEKILMRKERKKESGKKYYSKPEIKEKYKEGWKKEMKEVKDIINEKTPEILEEESQIYEKEYIPEEKVAELNKDYEIV